MLLEFRVANYLSFEKMTVFSMLASGDKTNEKDNVHLVNNKVRLLKSAGIYGANGSGKSNFIDAFGYMRAHVAFPENAKEDGISGQDRSFRLNKSNKGNPSYFEVTFFKEDKKFRYGFEIANGSVVSEWLFCAPNSREAKLFTREKQEIQVGNSFREARGLESNTKATRLFLTVVAELNGELAQLVVDWFGEANVLSGLSGSADFTLHLLSHGKKYQSRVLEILHQFDIQMENFYLKENKEIPFPSNVPKEVRAYFTQQGVRPSVITIRRTYDKGELSGTEEFDLFVDESDGTKKLFALAGFLVDALEGGDTLFVDELESKLHPLITRKIIEIFNSKKTNKKNAQLIFTTHDTNLLRSKCLRRDQIWFTEKDRYGCSYLYSLAEYKEKPRKDASFEKDYINGRYGAIPFIGDFSEILTS
jgi:AAA15 family ATPase/GTPase